jgi:hypothetical protein
MPIVFVHGVNNRLDAEYADNVVGRNGFLREILAPALGLSPRELHIASPYWGGDAATFAWKMAVLPDAAATYESFGAAADRRALRQTADLVAESSLHGGIVASARADLPGTIDLLYGASLAGVSNDEEARGIAISYQAASAYAEREPSPVWLTDGTNVTDQNFADLLTFKSSAGAHESFGAGGVLAALKEGISRLGSAVPAATSDTLWRLARNTLNGAVTLFVGDAFVYLKERGEAGNPGPIVKAVLDALRTAAAQRTATDRLVVVAHSFGGEIVYDILTEFAPDLHVDCLITVGSQVGLFEELKLYAVSSPAIPPDPPAGKVPKPKNLTRWLNVFDTNDILSYRVTPVFADTEDFAYDTGYSTAHAHSGYFTRPSFYKRLAARLTATPTEGAPLQP